MRKILLLFSVTFILSLFFLSSKVNQYSWVSAKEESISEEKTPLPSSYELFYPIVAGKTPDNNIYFLKTFKEWIASKLLFDPIRKADYHLVLSKKRIVESESLILKNKDWKLIEKTLDRAVSEVQKSVEITQKATQEGKHTIDLVNAIKSVGSTQIDFINQNLITNVKEEQKEYLIKTSNSIQELLDRI